MLWRTPDKISATRSRRKSVIFDKIGKIFKICFVAFREDSSSIKRATKTYVHGITEAKPTVYIALKRSVLQPVFQIPNTLYSLTIDYKTV